MTEPRPKEPSPGERALPDTTQDETGAGWGESPADRDGEDERFLRERPPHHQG
ncbi:hypothetical protein BH20ACT5_BH20ACT5_25810 [soil metagenome]